MKYLVLFFIIGCAHNAKERCSSDIPLEVAQCFLDEKQPIRALTLSEYYLKKNEQIVEWTLISFKSYLKLGNEKRAVSAIQKGIKAAPNMKYFETLITHFEEKNPAKVLDVVNEGLVFFPENKFLLNKKISLTTKG